MVAAPRILSLATAVPEHPLPQQAMRAFAPQLFPNRPPEKLEPLLSSFDAAGIVTRQICVPMEWLAQPHSWPERTRLYRRHAVALIREAAEKALDQAGLAPEQIDVLVVASTTGIATPSLDALLMEELPFRRDITRLPLFGFGCAGGALGLARAAQMARAMPGSRVLFLVVELCSLTFRVGDPTKSNVIAAALFGDGAAGMVLGPGDGPEVTATGEWTWPDSLAVMGWRVERDSFGVLFSRHIPGIIENDLPPVLGRFLAQHALTIADFDAFALHPGGTKVLAAYEKAFGLSPECLAPARRVIREHGNMSSATALFVLRELWNEPFRRCLLMAPGPGFSVGFVVLER
jgi:alkylresorcinol/alkylpyrone synthase